MTGNVLRFLGLIIGLACSARAAKAQLQLSPVNIQVRILQANEGTTVQATQCRVTLSKRVTRCGWGSILYGSTWGVWEIGRAHV
jgi:hypothetical protein